MSNSDMMDIRRLAINPPAGMGKSGLHVLADLVSTVKQ
jgi:hypothetical protein